MKQFGKILTFELKHFFKNKIFVGVTIFLVAAIAAVMFFPRIIALFETEDTSDSPAELSVMLVKADDPAQADMVKQAFAAALAGYDVQITDESNDIIKDKITSGDAECAFVMTDAVSYTYYVNNLSMYAKLGPDTGFDCIDTYTPSDQTAAFLGALERAGSLPKTILYSLNPADNQAIDTICGCFQNSDAVSKIQHGSAWWFNDHFQGMTDQLTSLANLGYLAGFVGMLTDSRSFLSYTRHDYFRRIMCNLIGKWVEDGEYPANETSLKKIVEGICFNNAKRYFNL